MFTLIEQGEVYSPESLGKTSVLLNGGSILKIGEIDTSSLEQLGIPFDVINASGCIVTPGLIDPHEHLLGGSGEEGFSSQTPEISASEIISAGITTVAGCLGVDTTMKTMAGPARTRESAEGGRAERFHLERVYGRGGTREEGDRDRQKRERSC